MDQEVIVTKLNSGELFTISIADIQEYARQIAALVVKDPSILDNFPPREKAKLKRIVKKVLVDSDLM